MAKDNLDRMPEEEFLMGCRGVLRVVDGVLCMFDGVL